MNEPNRTFLSRPDSYYPYEPFAYSGYSSLPRTEHESTNGLSVGGVETPYVRQAFHDTTTPGRQTSESHNTLLQKATFSNVSISEKTARRSRRRRGHFLSWWQELASCLMSLVALIGLCVTLASYRRKPSPDWPTWLSLNTIVAMYSVVLKTGILLVAAEGLGQLKWSWFSKDRPLMDLVRFDEASRGPGGALRLLWRLRWHDLAASCGALIAILALAMDPLAQQMLRYYDCSISLATEQAAVPRTNFFYDFDSRHISAGINSVSPGLQTAAIAGILGEATSVDFKCSTGNCTWSEEYSTFGYCSKCHDITDLLSIKNVTSNSSAAGWDIETSLPNDGLKVRVPGFATFHFPFAKIGPAPVTYDEGPTIDFVLAQQYSGDGMKPLIDSDAKCDTPDTASKWKCKGYGAARCHITPCVKTYAASVEVGVLREELIDTADKWLVDDTSYQQYAILDTHCINQDDRSSLEDLGYTIKADERWLPYSANTVFNYFEPGQSLNLTDSFADSLIQRNCVYAFNFILGRSLTEWFATQQTAARGSLFDGTVYGGSAYGDDGVYYGSQVAQAFYNFGNAELEHVDALFHNATESVTRYMRQHAEAQFSEPATGVVKENKTCVDVRWIWVLFPAALLMLASLFFAVVAIETWPRTHGPAIWKSSPLALLYHGFDRHTESKDVDDSRTDLQTIEGMEDRARRTVVQLQHSDDPRLEIKHGTS